VLSLAVYSPTGFVVVTVGSAVAHDLAEYSLTDFAVVIIVSKSQSAPDCHYPVGFEVPKVGNVAAATSPGWCSPTGFAVVTIASKSQSVPD
jgi:hypothetical protein